MICNLALAAAFLSLKQTPVKPVLPLEVASDRRPALHTKGDVLIKNGNLLTISNGVLDGTDILILKGKIAKIGKGLSAPQGVTIIDATGEFVSPGLVDAHSHRASDDTNEGADSITAEVRIQDVLNTKSLSLYYALASGITTSLILHGSANPVGGQSTVIKDKWERPIKEAIFEGAPRMVKFALGENPKRPGSQDSSPRFPGTRMGVEAVYRRAFTDALDYIHRWDTYEKLEDKSKTAPPRRDLRLEAMADILKGKLWVQCHSYRQDEMLMMVRLSQEFHFHLCMQHALEAYKIAPELAKAHVPVSMFGDGFTYKLEVIDSIPMATTICDKAGVIVSVNTDTSFGTVPLTQDAAKAIRYGMSVDHALRMITINPAIELGVERRVGSLEVGKDGDIAIWKGHPLSNYTKCVTTLIDGEVYFQRRDAFKVDGHSMVAASPESRSFDPSASLMPKVSDTYLITHATIHPVSGPVLQNSSLLIRNGHIEGIGAQVAGASGAVVIDGKGLDVYPGFIDGGSTLGLNEIGEVPSAADASENGDYKPDLRALNSINPDSIHFPKVRFNGVTSAQTLPGGGVIAGQTALVSTGGFTTDGIKELSPAALYLDFPAGPSALLKQFLPAEEVTKAESGVADRIKALEEYLEAGQRYEAAKATGQAFATDTKMEALQPYLKGTLPVIFHADSAATIRKALDLAKKFSLKAVIAGGNEAWQVADLLKERSIPVIYQAPSDACPDETSPPEDFDPYDTTYAAPGLLSQAGVRFCFMTNTWDMAMNLPFNAGRTCAFGLSHEAAIRALTLDAATILGVGDSLGSLDKGKIANVIIVSGDPLDLNSQLRYEFINGKPVPLESHYTDLYKRYMSRVTGK